MKSTTGLKLTIQDMAKRIRDLREIEGFTVSEMAKKTGLTPEEYSRCEAGESDLSFAFLYRCALEFGVDVTDLIQGSSPTLSTYTLTRRGEGQRIEEAHGLTYYNMAASYRNRIAEPLYVISSYSAAREHAEIELTTHEGQECDLIVRGKMKIQIGNHIEILSEGDSIYYDSSTPHGMVAIDGQDCAFYAIVLNPSGEGEKPKEENFVDNVYGEQKDTSERIYQKYIIPTENPRGGLEAIAFQNTEQFNFAYDILDKLAETKPNKLALLHVAADHTERRFTFRDIRQASNRAANFFRSLGISKGDRVMLVLKRHYQFWFAMMGLNKLGAIAIPATCQLKSHDFSYRFHAAGVSAIVCTADGDVAAQVEQGAQDCPTLKHKILVGGSREGWHDFDAEFEMFSSHFDRTQDTACGDDFMLMFFTSGTTGYPKIAAHSYKYPLGHFITAKYWHQVDPEGLHLTISDTGWAKAMWGKLYGQWLCEGAVFVYDFDRFDAADILPLFAKYQITTFCAPPTIYRMMIKQDISKYDLSSVKHATIAGEALNPEVFRQFEKATGLRVMEGFGQSETTLVIGNTVGMKHKLGSMGQPVPLYDVSLLDSDGNHVPTGETGEICIRTAEGIPCGLFREYYLDPEKTKECWHDGYYHTGDLAWKDEEGFYWYVGRADDVIKSSGYRIGPFEIENVIMELPYVLECGVSAAPDEIRGQAVKASIVLTKGTQPSEALKKEIQTYVKTHTAPYKYPRIVEFKDELPKTVSGKIQRNKL